MKPRGTNKAIKKYIQVSRLKIFVGYTQSILCYPEENLHDDIENIRESVYIVIVLNGTNIDKTKKKV